MICLGNLHRIFLMSGTQIAACLVSASLLNPASAQSLQDSWQRCTGDDPDIVIRACTTIIQSGQETSEHVATAFDNRGLAYANKDQFERAIQDFDQSIRLNPKSAYALTNRGMAYGNLGKPDRAIQDFDEAIRLSPSFYGAWDNRGSAYSDLGRYDLAIRDLNESIRLKPDYADAWNNRCWARAMTGDLPNALADCNESIRLRKGNSSLDSRGFVYLKMKNANAAIADYTAALAIAPKMPSSLYGRGCAEQMKGQLSAAQVDISAAKAIDPSIASKFEKWGVAPPR